MVSGGARVAHMDRVGALMDAWAADLSLPADECRRWRAAALAHDLLRDQTPEELRTHLPPGLAELPGALLHGPVGAEFLRLSGVEDGELLTAIAFHTLGDPRFRRLGRALYAADFLDPGRTFMQDWRAARRARMPLELDAVVREVATVRIGHQLERGAPIQPRTVEFWNSLAQGTA